MIEPANQSGATLEKAFEMSIDSGSPTPENCKI